MGKILKFPTGEVINEEINENELKEYLIEMNNQMQKSYEEFYKLTNNLLFGESKGYITNKNELFESVAIEVFKLWIAVSDYDIKEFCKKLKNF